MDSEDLRQHRKTRRLAWSAGTLLVVLFVLFGIAAVFATVQWKEASRQSRIADEQRQAAEEQRRVAEARRQEAEQQRQRAEDERQLALSRQLAAQALGQMSTRLDLGLLQSVQASAVRDTRESRSALLAALFSSPHLGQFLWNEPGTLKTAALSGDGRTVLALLEETGALRLQSITESGVRSLGAFPGGPGVTAVALSRDARLIAAASRGRVIVRGGPARATVETIVAGLERHGSAGVLAFSPDGSVLAGYDSSAGVLLWDVARRELRTPPLSPKRWETALALSPDSRIVASGGRDGTIMLWEVATGRALGAPLQGHSSKIFSLLFSPDGRVLASGSEDRTVRLWDAATGHALGPPLRGHAPWALGHETWGLSLAFSPDGQLLASAGKDGSLFLWSVAGRESLGPAMRGHPTGVVAVAFSQDGRALVSIGQDGTVARWATDMASTVGAVFEGLGDGTVDLTFSADGGRLAAASLEKTVKVWDVGTRRPLRAPLDRSRHGLVGLAFTPDGELLWGTRRELVESDPSTGRSKSRPLASDGDEISSMAFSPDRGLVAASNGSNLLLLDRATRRLARLPVATASNTHAVTSLAFSADGRTFASGAFDGTLAIWSVDTGQLVRPAVRAHREPVQSLAFTRDGKTLASAGVSSADFDPSVRLWDIATGQQLLPALAGHDAPVRALAFSPDGQILATADLDRVVLWHVESRQRLGQPLRGQGGPIIALAFSPDGNWLASGGYDDRVLLWDLRLETWVRRACAIANRRLSETEWTRLVGDGPYEPACR